ncbi:hypothetical protein [Halobacillus litoralis]|nr:hypothetical protein [Halobacillus litoralis]
MTIQFLIFKITVIRKKRQKFQELPGYRLTAQDQWLDRKSAFNRYI